MLYKFLNIFNKRVNYIIFLNSAARLAFSEQHAEAVAEVEVEGKSAFIDIDTPEMLADARRSSVLFTKLKRPVG